MVKRNKILLTVLIILIAVFCVLGIMLIIETNNTKNRKAIIESNDNNQPVTEQVQLSENTTETPTLEIKSTSILNAEFKEGDIVDVRNTNVEIKYTDGTCITANGNTIGFDDTIKSPLKSGVNTFNITYRDLSATLTIVADKLTTIESAAKKYADEYENADYKYLSDTVFLTITKTVSDDNDTYCVAHIILKDASQIHTCFSGDSYDGRNKAHPVNKSKNQEWIIGVNGTGCKYFEDYDKALIIRDKDIIINNDTSGNEICLTTDGTLFTPDAGISSEELLRNNDILHTWHASGQTLLNGTSNVEIENDTQMPRCAIGMVSPLEYYIITVSDGSYVRGVTSSELQNVFKEYGCTYAKIISSNEATQMVFDDKLINNPPASGSVAVIDFLYILDE